MININTLRIIKMLKYHSKLARQSPLLKCAREESPGCIEQDDG